MTDTPRFPAEWEPQSAILMAWPHAGTDWAARLEKTRGCFAGIAAAISRHQTLLLLVSEAEVEDDARTALAQADADLARVQFITLPYNDTWLRDSGPISLRHNEGFELLDFHFTAWGGKFEAGLDDRIVSELNRLGLFRNARHRRIDFALEGGGIETDGAGTLLSTWHCLHERHPEKSRADIEAVLKSHLRQHRVLWLEHGYLEGDDTDAHIDTLARFASETSIIYQACDDPQDSHYSELQAMAAELGQLRTAEGKPYTLHALPWPKPIMDEGRRLAASYANFLIINGAVLMPVYADAADGRALSVMQRAFPTHDIIGIPCRDLIWQNGSLHCCTMQLPEGLLK
ncbi:agmatine deiminase family protein [Arenimonas sp. GDDSR-1]|uniref:agmatine deiminase family protein n=1 Tax=Arenimonas sp. GDDSR-1 TaxID=2950125 RepID=UPI00260A8EC7|nr:agmatine deiminase family protein [Arenimonas sp. GDDSR-1]